MIRIRAAEPLEGYRVRLVFTDHTEKVVDLSPYLHGPVFAPLRQNSRLFRALKVDHELGTIIWPNGADIDPDVLYQGLQPAQLDVGAASGSR